MEFLRREGETVLVLFISDQKNEKKNRPPAHFAGGLEAWSSDH